MFSGFNIRAVVAFCRFATRWKIPFHIVAVSENDPIFQTAYAKHVFLIRDSSELCDKQVLKWMNEIRTLNRLDRVVVLPTSEYLNRFLLLHRSTFEDAGHVIPLAESSLYDQLSDKKSFAEICQKHGLGIPREFDSQPVQLPFVAKPLRYASTKTGKQLKPWLITNEDEQAEFQGKEVEADFFFQEYVQGKSIYLLYYVSSTDSDVCFSQENLIQQSNGGSIVAARTADAHFAPVADDYLKMLKSLGFHGVIMVELKQTNGQYTMIESNPRFWGPIQFVIDQGVPIVRQFMTELGFDNMSKCQTVPVPNQDLLYFWSGGISEAAQPLAFHNYTPDNFSNDYPMLICNDVFLRDDTIELYAQEFRKQQ